MPALPARGAPATAARQMEVLARVDADRLAALVERGEFFWLDLTAPSPADVRTVGELLGWHPLQIEDTTAFGERPKIDHYGDQALMVYYGAERPPASAEEAPEEHEPQAIEVHLHLCDRWLVTARPTASPDVEAIRADVAATIPPEHGRLAVHRVLDALTDSLLPLVHATEDELDLLEDQALRAPDRRHLELLAQLRRRVSDLRRVVGPQARLLRYVRERLEPLPGLDPDAAAYFRDVQDEMDRVADRLEVARELLGTATDVYFSAVSHRLNATGERLTEIATILLPLTVVTGFFGMNFEWMVANVESPGDFFVLGIGAMILSVTVAYLYVLRQRRRL